MTTTTRILACTLAAAIALGAADGAARAGGVNCYTTTSPKCAEQKARPLPKSVDEFKKLRDQLGADPWAGATLLIYALIVRTSDKALGDQLLVLAVSERNLSHADAGGTLDGYSLAGRATLWMGQADKQAHCLRGYAAGSSPDNDYKVDPRAVGLRFLKQENYVGTIDSGKYKVFVCNTGTDSCRPVTLTRNKNGVWKADEFSSLVAGCRPAASAASNPADDAAADKL